MNRLLVSALTFSHLILWGGWGCGQKKKNLDGQSETSAEVEKKRIPSPVGR